MITISKRFGLACALGAILIGSGVGVAVAQGWWQVSEQQTRRPPSVQNQAYFPVRKCINMGSALEAPKEGEWGYTIRQRDMVTIANAGFDTVRIPIKWSAHAETLAPFKIDPAFFARIDQVLAWAQSAKLNVIINVHHYDELYTDPDQHEPRLDALWTQIAAHYQTAPANVLFEIINEPRDAFSGPRVNTAQGRVLQIIRQSNPRRTVILTGDAWGGLDGMDNLQLPPDPYLVGTVHYYSPYEFTHQGASWLPNPPPPGRTWPLGSDLTQLKADIRQIEGFRNRIQAPVLMGEYGVTVEVPMARRAAWTADVRRAFDEINLPSCYFNFAAGFSTYDLVREQWHAPLLQALGLQPLRLERR